jgi:hypothetical protein
MISIPVWTILWPSYTHVLAGSTDSWLVNTFFYTHGKLQAPAVFFLVATGEGRSDPSRLQLLYPLMMSSDERGTGRWKRGRGEQAEPNYDIVEKGSRKFLI